MLIEEEYVNAEDAEEDDDDDSNDGETTEGDESSEGEETEQNSEADESDEFDEDNDSGEITEEEKKEREAELAHRLAARKTSAFARLFRSKGFLWLATRPSIIGDWAQAGSVLTIKSAGNWFCLQPESLWPCNCHEECMRIKKDFDSDERVGDRRQELVFIGNFGEGQQAEIEAELNACLLTEEEWNDVYLTGNLADFEDPWEEWPAFDPASDSEDEGENVENAEINEEENSAKKAKLE